MVQQAHRSGVVTDAVLVEVLFQLESRRAYGFARAVFMPDLLRLLQTKPWAVHSLTLQALTIFSSSNLDYVDCLLSAMEQRGAVSGVATFDKALQKQLGTVVL